MKKITIIVITLIFIFINDATAQNRKIVSHKKNATPAVVNESDALYINMLPATAKVMFIDSIVVEKTDFFKHIPLNKESGTIYSYNNFFNANEQRTSSVFENEFGTRCYFAQEDTIYGDAMFVMNKLGDNWEKPQQLIGIDDEYSYQNFPFMMADGITLFFAAKGNKSIGGYDLFMTLFDSEHNKFYTPENYGLPFNSKANDYMIAYDELDTLGWLVTDRNQPEWKVCIYTFVPTYPRVSFDSNTTKEQLESYARLTSIKDTWKFGDREKAMNRLAALKQRLINKKTEDVVSFIVNDNITYKSINDFRSSSNKELFTKLNKMKSVLKNTELVLDNKRIEYHNATSHVKREMQTDVISLEKEIENMRNNIHETEKKIRNTENLLLKK